MCRILVILTCLIPGIQCFSQSDDTATLSATDKLFHAYDNISNKSLRLIQNKYSKLTSAVEKQTEKMLQRMQRKEAKLRKKLENTDSVKAKALFAKTKEKYQKLQDQLQNPVNPSISNPLKQYIPGLDSLQTATRFLSQSNINIPGLPADKLQQIQAISGQLHELQGRLQQANNIQQYIREREGQLKQALANTKLGKELIGLNREVYYYQQRLSEYKELLQNPDKLEEKLLATIRDLPAFQKFWEKNSILASLFRMPDNFGTPQSLAGLQTRANVQSIMNQRVAMGGGSSAGMNPQQYMQQQMQAAQSQLNALKDKLNRLGGGSGNSDMTMPDFKPNSQHTKTFFQRLEYGLDIQSQRTTNYLPATTDIALTLGYKLNDKTSTGVGLAYKLGLGSGWNHIRLSNEGIGLRSYVDIAPFSSLNKGRLVNKVFGNFWLSGGFEYNYMQSFSSLSSIKNLDIWQRSALLGLTKKYKIGKKREGKIQLLYDFLYNKQTPPGQPLKFRVGWNF